MKETLRPIYTIPLYVLMYPINWVESYARIAKLVSELKAGIMFSHNITYPRMNNGTR